jgi:hypothetical protein
MHQRVLVVSVCEVGEVSHVDRAGEGGIGQAVLPLRTNFRTIRSSRISTNRIEFELWISGFESVEYHGG